MNCAVLARTLPISDGLDYGLTLDTKTRKGAFTRSVTNYYPGMPIKQMLKVLNGMQSGSETKAKPLTNTPARVDDVFRIATSRQETSNRITATNG